LTLKTAAWSASIRKFPPTVGWRHPKLTEEAREFCIVGGHQATVPEAADVLRREKRERTHCAVRADIGTVVVGAPCLGAIFDDRNLTRRFGQHLHISGLTEEMDRDHRFRAAIDLLSDLARIKTVVDILDVDEDRRRAEPRDNPRSGEKGKARKNDLVPSSYAEGHQRDQESIGPRGDPHRVLDPEPGGRFVLKGLDLRSKDEELTDGNLCKRRFDGFTHGFVLSGQVEQGNGHRTTPWGLSPATSPALSRPGQGTRVLRRLLRASSHPETAFFGNLGVR
jgi:hypothetical protein